MPLGEGKRFFSFFRFHFKVSHNNFVLFQKKNTQKRFGTKTEDWLFECPQFRLQLQRNIEINEAQIRKSCWVNPEVLLYSYRTVSPSVISLNIHFFCFQCKKVLILTEWVFSKTLPWGGVLWRPKGCSEVSDEQKLCHVQGFQLII